MCILQFGCLHQQGQHPLPRCYFDSAAEQQNTASHLQIARCATLFSEDAIRYA